MTCSDPSALRPCRPGRPGLAAAGLIQGPLTAVASAVLLAAPAALAAPLTITAPIQVPLHWTPITSGFPMPTRKLGLYVALGGGSSPQLFEFDTGGAGFYPAYSEHVNWWGSDLQENHPYGKFNQGYNSGTSYEGRVVTTSVSLYGSPSDPTPLFTATDVVVGRASQISNSAGTTVWNSASTAATPPPLLGAFWGDFGMAPKQGQQGQNTSGSAGGPTIDSLISQLAFGSGVTAGYRVHASSENPWVQFGLGPADLVNLPTSFALNGAGLNSATGVPYYDAKVISGALQVSLGSSGLTNADTGILFDTGAFTTIHQSGVSTVPPTSLPADLINPGSGYPYPYLQPGTQVVVSAQTLGLSSLTPFMAFEAGTIVDQNLVDIQTDSYYLNTGILPFLSNDIIYNLQNAQLTLVPQPTPEPLSVTGLAAAGALSRRLRRLARRARRGPARPAAG
jgi:hypothetical protein